MSQTNVFTLRKSFTLHFLYLIVTVGFIIASKCNSNPYFKNAGPFVKTSSGSMVGKYLKAFNADIPGFFGIPFAEPPVGEKRFKLAEPIIPWQGILDATKMSPPCMQYSSRNYSWIPKTDPSENCLYLNIWVPSKNFCGSPVLFPVIVWIYGGGFHSGSTDIEMYDGSILSSYGNAVVVSINYRVGVFGFLNSGTDDAKGNMGLYDQALALTWIQENIKYFGGDSSRTTIMGESAGAISASLHVISPVSRKLFRRAILQSATAYHTQIIDNLPVSQFKALTFSKLVGCASANESEVNNWADVVSCLRKKEARVLSEAEDIFTSKFPSFFLPSIGNEFLPNDPIETYEAVEDADVEVLLGITKDEATIFLNYIIPELFSLDQTPRLNLESADSIIKALFKTVPNPPANDIFSFYFGNSTKSDSTAIAKTISNAFGDYVFNCPVLFLAEKLKNVFVYWITHRSLLNPNAEWLGVPHFIDVPYVFGVPMQDVHQYTHEDGRFSGSLIHKWVSFANNGYPLEDNDKWPKFTTTNPVAFELNPKSERNSIFPRLEACEFWRPYFKRQY